MSRQVTQIEDKCECCQLTVIDDEPFPFNIDIKKNQSFLNITKCENEINQFRVHRTYNSAQSFDNVSTSKDLELQNSHSPHGICSNCEENNQTKGKKTIWFRAKKYFNFKRNKKSNICDDEICSDLDPVYHILLNGASQNWNKLISDKSLNGKCHDISCPCNDPRRIPIITKEDIGQQAKRDISNALKRCQSTNLRIHLSSSNSTYSISSNFSR